MKLLGILIFIMTLTSSMVLASAGEISIYVKGMVCSFCGQGIQKKFSELPEVEEVTVDMDAHLVKIRVKNNSLTDEKITDLLKEAGYNVESIKRTP